MPTDTNEIRLAPMSTVGLFSGIGGLELGLSRAGHQTTLLCENDRVARTVLDHRFVDIAKHGDVRTLKALPKDTELLAAGFPCQDLSQAGRTAGIDGDQSGLVSEVFRLLKARRAPWVLLENVPFMLHVKKGAAFEVVLKALEKLGYRWAYRVIDSRAFGLPQRRERVFILASLEGDPRGCLLSDDEGPPETSERGNEAAIGFYWTEGNKGLGWAVDAIPALKRGSALGIASPPAILLPSGVIIKPDIRDAERMQGFPANWTDAAKGNQDGRKTRRWGLVGNAVTVDVATWLGRKLRRYGEYRGEDDRALKPGDVWPRAGWSMGSARHASSVSTWPVQKVAAPLHTFLRFPGDLLSEKATLGFFTRASASTLRIPEGFLDRVEAHLNVMRQAKVA
ncbi:MAG: DNA (cytosine-5-)-methyltransferase [Myxococcales bacterium]